MKLEYIGHACFNLAAEGGFSWVTDPYDGTIGLAQPAVRATVTTLSHGHFDHNCVEALTDAGEVLSAPGEYEAGGARFTLISSYHDEVRGAKRGANLITLCEVGGLRICHLGDLGHQPDEAQLRALGRVDVLLIPVGGTYTLDGEGAARAARAIAPRTIVPMHFKVPHLLLDIAAPGAFLSAMGPYTEVGSELELDSAPAGVVMMAPAR